MNIRKVRCAVAFALCSAGVPLVELVVVPRRSLRSRRRRMFFPLGDLVTDSQEYVFERCQVLAPQVVRSLQHQVRLEEAKALLAFDGDFDRASMQLRSCLQANLAEGDELWYFSTPIRPLAAMAGYAVMRAGELHGFVVTVQS